MTHEDIVNLAMLACLGIFIIAVRILDNRYTPMLAKKILGDSAKRNEEFIAASFARRRAIMDVVMALAFGVGVVGTITKLSVWT